MKKLNNKGFAISTLLYSMIILVMMIVMIMLSIMATTRKTTKELSETIEQELTEHAKTEAEFNTTGTYKIPKDGWYKIEIWSGATNKYYSSVISYSTGTNLAFSFSSGNVTMSPPVSAEREIYNPGLSFSKAKIKLVSEDASAPSKYTYSSTLNNGKYYIGNSSTGQIKVLTVDTSDNSVSFQPLNGETNQEWVVDAKKTAGGTVDYYKMINSATGLILSPEEENGSANTNLVAKTSNSNPDQEWIKWSVTNKGSGIYEIETQLSNNILTFDETANKTILEPLGSLNSQFYFLYSQY